MPGAELRMTPKNFVALLLLMQCVLPFFVATNMSQIRKTSFMVPGPREYARKALATVGLESRTFGCLSHAIQVCSLCRLLTS